MKITFIGKYPPIQGGVSARAYWFTRALGERGIEMHVVTNADLVEDMYREKLDLSDPETKKLYVGENVHIHTLTEKAPRHIPYSQGYVSRLTNLGLKVIGDHGSDLIFAHYLEPYGVVALFLKQQLGTPYITQHAGSDLYTMFQHKDYTYLLGRVMRQADGMFISARLKDFADELNIKQLRAPHLVVNTDVFSPRGELFDFEKYGVTAPPAGVPVITSMGKANNFKGLEALLESLTHVKQDFRFAFVSDGFNKEELLRFVDQRESLKSKFLDIGFIPPWDVPALLRSTSIFSVLENNFPIPIHTPLQPYEAIATGTPMLLSGEMYDKIAGRFEGLEDSFAVVKNPDNNSAELAEKIVDMLENHNTYTAEAILLRDRLLEMHNWDEAVDAFVQIFASTVHTSTSWTNKIPLVKHLF